MTITTPAPARPATTPTATTLAAAALASRLALHRSLWAPHARFDPDEPRHVPVWQDDHWEAELGAWLPGQSTGIVERIGRPGALVVLQGRLEESTWVTATDGPFPGQRHAVVRRWNAGSVRSHGAVHVHDLRNAGPDPALALHLRSRV